MRNHDSLSHNDHCKRHQHIGKEFDKMLILTGEWGMWTPWTECEGEVSVLSSIICIIYTRRDYSLFYTPSRLSYKSSGDLTNNNNQTTSKVARQRVRSCLRPPCSGDSRQNSNCSNGEEIWRSYLLIILITLFMIIHAGLKHWTGWCQVLKGICFKSSFLIFLQWCLHLEAGAVRTPENQG